jgi:hypothetical protein
MLTSTHRSTARLLATVLLVLLVGGCTRNTTTPTARSQPSTTSGTVAPTSTTNPPMTAAELAWLNAVTRLHDTIDKPFLAGDAMTRAKMVELANALEVCSRELPRIGSPSRRLQPVYRAVKGACRIYDKGAKCFATAASVSDPSGAVVAGSPEVRTQQLAIDCGFQAQGNCGELLTDAKAKGEEIKGKAG